MTAHAPNPFSGSVTVYPSSTAGTTVTAGATNTWGSTAELVAAGAIAAQRRLSHMTVTTPSGAAILRVQLRYVSGGASTLLTERRVEVASDAGALEPIDCLNEGGIIPASAQIVARTMTSGSAETCAVSVGLQEV